MSKIRKFKTGATRDTNQGKYEFARFLDPRVLKEFARYMHVHRKQADGKLRDPDNWKKGMGLQTWMDSMGRHYHDVWEIHEYGECIRPETGERIRLIDALCGLLFNVMGYMFEIVRHKKK